MAININFESKAMEQIQVELASDIFKGVRGHIEEAITMAIGERWEDIFRAVIEAQPAPNVVSNEQYDKLLNDNIEMDAEIVALREENFQLQMALIGASCKLQNCPVRALEEAGEVSVDEELSVVEKATMEALEQVKEMPPMKSLMEEAMEPMSEIEESWWTEEDDIILVDEDPNEDLDNELSLLEEDDLILPEEEEEQLILPDEEDEDPFANDTTEDKVLEVISGDEPFDPFSADTNIDVDMDDIEVYVAPFSEEFGDEDAPPVLEGEEESNSPADPELPKLPALPDYSPIDTPVITPLAKDETKVVTYLVHDKEVKFAQANYYLNGIKNKLVKDMAFKLHNVMMQKNDRYKASKKDKDMGKFYTQMIREWGLEIAAANNIELVKGDDGCAVLIAELFYSMNTEKQSLMSPQLRARNEEEKKAAGVFYYKYEEAKKFVDIHKNALALDPMMFVGTKKLDKETTLRSGYALLQARMSLTWDNAMGKTKCVFPEVRTEHVKKAALK